MSDGTRIVVKPFTKIYPVVLTKRINERSSPGVNCFQIVVHRYQESAIRPILALPVVDSPVTSAEATSTAPAGHVSTGLEVMHPDFFCSRGLESDKRAILS